MNEARTLSAPSGVRARLSRLLKSELALNPLAPKQPAGASFRCFVSRSISVLDVQGAAIDLHKAASQTRDVHLLCLQQGAVELSYGEGRIQLHAGDYLAYRGARAMQFRHEHSIELTAVVLPARAIERWLPDWQAAELVPISRPAEGRLCFDISRDLLERREQLHDETAADIVSDAVARLMARSLSHASLSDAAAPQELAEAHRRKVKMFCRKNLGSTGLSVEHVARATGLSRASLHRLFRDQPCSLMKWLQLERLEASRRLLGERGVPARSLTEIALSVGFKSSSHFSAAFRQRFGVTPRDYRAARQPARHRRAQPTRCASRP